MDELLELIELRDQLDSTLVQIREEIGIVLKELRQERGLSLREAADILDCDFSNLRRSENGLAFSPSIIAKVLKQYPRIPLISQGLRIENNTGELIGIK